MPPEDAACGLAVRTACRAEGFEPRVRWETDDMLLLARAVADGHGVAVLPLRSVAAAVEGIDVRPLREPPLNRRLYAVAARAGAVAAGRRRRRSNRSPPLSADRRAGPATLQPGFALTG